MSASLFNQFGMSPISRRAAATPGAISALDGLAHSVARELRYARLAKRWTLRELAERAGVAVASAQAAESGRAMSLETYARLAVALGRRPELSLPSRVGRHVEPLRAGRDTVHAAMGELEARQLSSHGFAIAIDEPYQHYQFAGRADVIAWDLETRALLHVENKSDLPDLQDLAGSYNAKRAYLPAAIAQRLNLDPRGWASVTHALVVLWSSDVLHVLRLRSATFAALCPSPSDPFAAWWAGKPPNDGVTSSLIVFDPVKDLPQRRARFVGVERAGSIQPRYRTYADAAAALDGRHRP